MTETSKLKKKFFFSINSKAMKNEDGVKRYPVSSTSEDRDGDDMTVEMLESMAKQINEGHVAFYADHGLGPNGYYSAFDKLGSWTNAVVENDKLYATPKLREKPETEQVKMMREMLEDDTPITFSIGFLPKDFKEKGEGAGGMTYSFTDGDLMEISGVGIPSNPDAVSASFKSLINYLKNSEIKNTQTEQSEEQPMTEKEIKEMPEDEDPEKEKVEDPEDEEEQTESKEITPEDLQALKEEIIAGVLAGIKDMTTESKAEDPEEEEEEEKSSPEPEVEKSAPTPKGKGPEAPEPKIETNNEVVKTIHI